jgi:Phage integrase family
VSRRCLGRAAQLAGLNDDGWPPLRFHDLRHTFASHLIIDLRLDPAQVSRMLGHARITITLDTYTHMFEDARHTRDIRTSMAASPFAQLLEPMTMSPGATVLQLRQPGCSGQGVAAMGAVQLTRLAVQLRTGRRRAVSIRRSPLRQRSGGLRLGDHQNDRGQREQDAADGEQQDPPETEGRLRAAVKRPLEVTLAARADHD